MEKGQNMKSASSLDPEESDGEVLGNPSRGSTHAMWTQRRQAKQRTRVRAKRRGASMAAQKGMHLRRNKRVSWNQRALKSQWRRGKRLRKSDDSITRKARRLFISE
jgi:hypothetical protein